jgi:hypothetical protein
MNCEKCGAETEFGKCSCETSMASVPTGEPTPTATPTPAEVPVVPAPPAPTAASVEPIAPAAPVAPAASVVPAPTVAPAPTAVPVTPAPPVAPTPTAAPVVPVAPTTPAAPVPQFVQAPPQGYYPSQGFAPQGYPQQGFAPQGYPQQGFYPPQVMVYPQTQVKRKSKALKVVIISILSVIGLAVLGFFALAVIGFMMTDTPVDPGTDVQSAVSSDPFDTSPSVYTNTFEGECFKFTYPDDYEVDDYEHTFCLYNRKAGMTFYPIDSCEYTYNVSTKNMDTQKIYQAFIDYVTENCKSFNLFSGQEINTNQYTVLANGTFVGYLYYTYEVSYGVTDVGTLFLVASSEKDSMAYFDFYMNDQDDLNDAVMSESEKMFEILQNGSFWRKYENVIFKVNDNKATNYASPYINFVVPNLWSLTDNKAEDDLIQWSFDGPESAAKLKISFIKGQEFTDKSVLDMLSQSGAVLSGKSDTFSVQGIDFVHVRTSEDNKLKVDGYEYNYDAFYCISKDKNSCYMFEFIGADWMSEADVNAYRYHIFVVMNLFKPEGADM